MSNARSNVTKLTSLTNVNRPGPLIGIKDG